MPFCRTLSALSAISADRTFAIAQIFTKLSSHAFAGLKHPVRQLQDAQIRFLCRMDTLKAAFGGTAQGQGCESPVSCVYYRADQRICFGSFFFSSSGSHPSPTRSQTRLASMLESSVFGTQTPPAIAWNPKRPCKRQRIPAEVAPISVGEPGARASLPFWAQIEQSYRLSGFSTSGTT